MTDDMTAKKQLLRRQMLNLRAGIPLRERLVSDAAISRQVVNLSAFKDAEVIFAYVSTDDEIDTRAIIEEALKQGKRICVPRCEGRGIMRAYEIASFDDLQEGSYGILEPRETCRYVEPKCLDLALVPCMGCTSRGERLGYGGGFYDRYLQDRTYPAAALCRDALLLDELPVGEYDVPVDLVITESGAVTVNS
jgi:5-formyltetrahydrofolate cyclo-ligase